MQLSYAIGVVEPTSVFVDCRGTNEVSPEKIARAVRDVFPLTPRGIMETLRLKAPIYTPSARHGHFGRVPGKVERTKVDGTTASYETFTWEKTDKAEALKKAVG